MRPSYTVQAELDGRFWALSVPDVPGALSQARRLADAESMIREAIALVLEVPEDSFDVVIDAELPAAAAQALDALQGARESVNSARKHLAEAQRATAEAFQRTGLTLRDSAVVLGLSHQRVHQLLHDEKVDA